ncbi:MAG: CPBP family intramembrane metalloprotease [Oscillospiraceae bacterium]|nr:CPBP family intramembrane metalloprotease [Oscillospiraceae bacterium]
MQQFQNFGSLPVLPPEQQRMLSIKKSLQSDVMKASLFLVTIILAVNVLSTLIGIGAGIVSAFIPAVSGGGDLSDVYNELLDSQTFNFFAAYLPMALCEIAAVLIAMKLFRMPFSRIIGHNQAGAGFTVMSMFGCVGIGIIGQVLSILTLAFLELIRFPLYVPELTTDWSDPLGSVLLLLYVCILGPIAEELIFRGVILKLLQKHGVSFAVIFSAFLFMLFHQNVAQIFLPFLLGIMLALITIRSGSIVPAILAHILNNSLAMVLDVVLPLDNMLLYWIGYIIYAIVMLGLGIIFLILYGDGLKPILKWRSPEMRLSRQLVIAGTHWSTLIVIGIYAAVLVYTMVIELLNRYL